MKTFNRKHHFVMLLLIWTLIIVLFQVYNYIETESVSGMTIEKEITDHPEKDTSLKEWAINHQKRSFTHE